jgi:tetratricopeptide (TPR) repeat protein
MARKKIDKQFATTLAAVSGGIVVLGAAVYFWRRQSESPAQYMAMAEVATQAHDTRGAYSAYARAVKLSPKSAELRTNLAAFAHNAISADPQMAGQEVKDLESAREIDPKYVPANRRLMNIFWAVANAQHNPDSFKKVRDYADSIIGADPKDNEAICRQHASWVLGWTVGVDTPAETVEREMATLKELIAKGPSSKDFEAQDLHAELTLILAKAYLKQAIDGLSAGNAKVYKEKPLEAEKLLTDTVAANPDDLPLLYRALYVYDTMRHVNRDQPEHAKLYADALARARELAKPDSRLYVDVNLEAARDMALSKDRAGAGEIYKKLMELKSAPQFPVIQIRYAEFLAADPNTRKQAIEVLTMDSDRAAASGAPGLDAGRNRPLEARRRLNRETYLVDEAASGATADERERRAKAISAEVTRLSQDYPNDALPLVLVGRIQLLTGRAVEAVHTLEFAKTKLERSAEKSGEKPPEYLDLLLKLSEAYAQAQQTGPAKDAIRQVIAARPSVMQFRAQLIRILLTEGNTNDAVSEYKEAAKISQANPSDTEGAKVVAALEQAIRTLSPGGVDEAAGDFQKLPETNKDERVRKGRLLMSAGKLDLAEKVLSDAFAEDPKDATVALILIQCLARDGKVDTAKTICASARAGSPDNLQLKYVEATLNKATPADLRRIYLDTLKDKDETTREMALYELANQDGDGPAALKHLQRAAELSPNDRRVLDQTFLVAVRGHDFAKAEKMIPALSENNYDQANGNLYRFQLAREKGDVPEALRLGRQMSTELPQFAVSWISLGQAYALSGDWQSAYTAFLQAIEKQPNNADALRGAIESAYQSNRTDDAERILADAMVRFPGDPSFLQQKRSHELSYGNPDPVIKDTLARLRDRFSSSPDPDKALAEDPGSQIEIARMYSQVVAACVRRGDVAGMRTMAAKALEAYGLAEDHLPAAATVDERLRLMATVNDLAGKTADPGVVEQRLLRVAATDELSGRWEPRLILAEFYKSVGRLDDAVRLTNEGIAKGGTAAPARRAAAVILSGMGKIDEALAALDGIAGAADDASIQHQRLDIVVNGRRFDQAEKMVRDRLAKTPSDVELQNLLSNIYINTGRYSDARRQVDKTLSSNPGNLAALYYRGLIQLRGPGGDLNSAIQDLQAVRDGGQGVTTTEMRLALVEAYERSGKHDDAMREVESMLKAEPTNRQIRLQYVNALLGDKSYATARKVIDDGLALPELASDPELLMFKSRLLSEQGDGDGAVALARQAVVSSRTAPGIFRGYLNLLIDLKREKDVMSETDPFVKSGNPLPVWLLETRGVARQKLGDLGGALSEFSAALGVASASKNPDLAVEVAADMSRVLGPEQALKAAMAHSTESVRWRLLLSAIYQSQRKLDKALGALEGDLANIDKLSPSDQVQVLTPAGMCLVSEGPQQNYDRAADIYRRLVKLTPNDYTALNNLSFIIAEKIKKPDFAEALQYSQSAYDEIQRLGQVQPLIYDTHGWNLVLNNRVAEGISLLNQAADRSNFLEVHFHLGVAYTKAGYLDEGKAELEKAKALSDQAGSDPSYKSRIADAMQQNAAAQKAKAAGK